ncbi:zinc-ribbon domain-containing protein [Mycobacteroides abscessus]|uniref:zinc-ribbon domain-containing protein n=1 Tax=Mycobacteroides abscessus TaxID=36809 RepID=UPI001EEB4270|nr:zinc-ribbon domain-containing protein [Mycobacteroides abscessus]
MCALSRRGQTLSRAKPGAALTDLHPEIAAQWHPTRNGSLRPDHVKPKSNKPAVWLCDLCAHEWPAVVASRTRGAGCPACNGRAVTSTNNLAVMYPDIAAQWHSELNGDLKPVQVGSGSDAKRWWECPYRHTWRASVYARVHGSGCPKCSGWGTSRREQQVRAELRAAGWTPAESGTVRVTERKNPYRCDVVIEQWKLVIEYDGWYHHSRPDQLRKDQFKTKYLENDGWTVIRIRENLDPVNRLCDIVVPVGISDDEVPGKIIAPVLDRAVQLGVLTPIPADQYLASVLENGLAETEFIPGRPPRGTSLAEQHPELANQWHPHANKRLLPDLVTSRSGHRAWWLCPDCGHMWRRAIAARSEGAGCPACVNQVLTTTNNLAARFPDIAAQWHPSRNGELQPDQVVAKTGRRVWWLCAECGYSWRTAVGHRIIGTGCPGCSSRAVTASNNLAALHPMLAAQWHPTRNGDLQPNQVVPGSNKKTWWLCPDCGNEWQAIVGSRAAGSGCKQCSRAQQGVLRARPAPGKSLADVNPKVAAEWHPILNGELRPTQVRPNSNRKLWWQCPKCGHTWRTTAATRNYGRGCPACAGRAVTASNNLAVLFPEVAAQWHPTLNNDLRPNQVVAGSDKKPWWNCQTCGHAWQATVDSRTRGSGCPACAGHVVTASNNLAVLFPEVAAQWHPTLNNDLRPNQVVAGTSRLLWWLCPACAHEWQAPPAARVRGNGCAKCGVMKRSASRARPKPGQSLAENFPELVRQWHPTRNGGLTALQVCAKSGKKIWWQCRSCGHEWTAPPKHRSNGVGCPGCAGQAVTAANNLTVKFREIAAQWHPTRNGDLLPEQFTAGSGKRVWWQCDNGHEWQSTIDNRTKGKGCRQCRRPGLGTPP